MSETIAIKTEGICKHCKGTDITVAIWESYDGAYEDNHYRCLDCGKD